MPGAALEPADISSLNHPATDDENRPPKLIQAVNPIYPLEPKMLRITGVVVVMFVVDTNGKVRVPTVIESPDPRLSKAAVDAILQWEFLPGVRNGKKVNVRMRVPFTFALNP
jgi:TonB family protein